LAAGIILGGEIFTWATFKNVWHGDKVGCGKQTKLLKVSEF